jgi:cyclic pyranopterin phosphate synthase
MVWSKQMGRLTHIDDSGSARMVDVSGKEITRRTAVAQAVVETTVEVISAVRNSTIKKKVDVVSVCRVAGIMAAKKTSELIPLCHPLPIDSVSIEISLEDSRAVITAEAVTTAKTGLEMEVLTAASVSALTFYDMCKAIDKSMTVSSVRLLEKQVVKAAFSSRFSRGRMI